MKGKLFTELDTILQELKKQNNQINTTLKSLKKNKSVEIMPSKISKSVIDFTTIQKGVKTCKGDDQKHRKSKTFHRCTSCKIIDHAKEKRNQKQNTEKSKEKDKITKKAKPFSILQVHRKSNIQKSKSPTRNSTITAKYMGMLNTKRSKRL